MAEGIRTGLSYESLRKFGITMAACFAAIALLVAFKHRHSPLPACFISALFIFMAFAAPNTLKPIYTAWMKIGYILGWINTRIILAVIFYLVFTPMGLVMRLFGADLLDLKIDKNKKSYWLRKENKGMGLEGYERQF